MTNTISILGSTGSIGRQTLDVAEQLGLRVAALTANSNVERMEAQCRKFQPRLAVMTEESAAAELKIRLAGHACKGTGRYGRAGGSRCAAGSGYGSDRRGGHGGAEAHAGRDPGRESALRWPIRRHWCVPESW